MDGNYWSGGPVPMGHPPQGGADEQSRLSRSGDVPPIDPDDWRAQLPLDSRYRIAKKILETLKKCLPFSGQEELLELMKISVRFEEKTFSVATSQSDYLRKISLKLLTMETKSPSPTANSLQTNAANASRKSSDLASHSMQSQILNQALAMPILGDQSQGRQQILSQNNIAAAGVQNSASLTSALPAVSNLTQGSIANSALLQQQNALEHMKQFFPSQPAIPKASSTSLDSTAQTGNTDEGDWQEEVYQKIKSMKDMYLLEVIEIYVKIATKLQQDNTLPPQLNAGQLDKVKYFKIILERLSQFLLLGKNDIRISHKDKLASVENQIILILQSIKPRNIASLQPGQLSQPHMPGMQNSQQQSQIPLMQTHENQMNPRKQPMNVQSSAATMTQKNLSALHHNTLSFVTSHQNMLNSLQPSSNSDLGQSSSLLVNSLQQNTLSGSQPVNMRGSLSSQTGVNTLQSNFSMLQNKHLNLKRHEQLQSQQMQQVKQQISEQFVPGHTMSPIPSPQLLQPQMDQQKLVSPLPKTGTANSPFIIPSHSTPLAPSQVNSTGTGYLQASNAAGSAQSLAIGTPGILTSPLLSDFTSLDIGVHGNSSKVISGSPNTAKQLMKGVGVVFYALGGCLVFELFLIFFLGACLVYELFLI